MNVKRSKDGSKGELARRLGISTASVAKIAKSGKIDAVLAPNGAITDVDEAIRLVEANSHPMGKPRRKVNRNTDAETLAETAEELGIDAENLLTYNDATTLLKNCQARLAQIELHEKEARMVDQEVVAKEWFRCARVARDAVLAVPDRLSAELAGMTDPFAVHSRLTEELRGAIAEIVKAAEA